MTDRGSRKSFLSRVFSHGPFSITFCSILTVLVLYLLSVPILDLIELKSYDLRFVSRGHLTPSPAIVLAVIDEKSLDNEGRWPWPRSKMARLVEILSNAGAKVIGFDIGFLEPERESGRNVPGEQSRIGGASGGYSKSDMDLAKAIANSQAKVVLGYFFHMSSKSLDYELPSQEIELRLKQIQSSMYPQLVYDGKPPSSSPFVTAYAPEINLEIFNNAAQSSGFFNMIADRDGVLRWMPLLIRCGDGLFPPLSILCVWHYLDHPPLVVKAAMDGVEGVQIGERFIATNERGKALINFLGPPKTFPHYSITDILSGHTPPEGFRGKIVLIGSTAMGIYDERNTPFTPVFPGLEVHASVIDNIMNQRFLMRDNVAKATDLVAIILLGTVLGIALPRLNALRGTLFAAGVFTAYILFGYWMFASQRTWLNLTYPLLVIVLTYVALTVYHYLTEERERKRIRATFSHYVSDVVIEEMLKDPTRLTLGGEEKVLTVLFSDLAGFTTYTEQLRPQEMVSILSDYFKEMTEQVFAHKGTLKEYVADELMAIFGAPLEFSDHAEQACAAALAMRDRLRELREQWREIGRPALRARTGINSGPMLVGNLGSPYRFAYGVLGDDVNLGSRLEGLNKVYGTEILIGENTATLVGDSFKLRELDMVRVKGKKKPVRVYELLERGEASLSIEQEEGYGLYKRGLEAYRLKRWEEALMLFQEVLSFLPEDGPSKTMMERCRIFLDTPPQREWDGVFDQLTK